MGNTIRWWYKKNIDTYYNPNYYNKEPKKIRKWYNKRLRLLNKCNIKKCWDIEKPIKSRGWNYW